MAFYRTKPNKAEKEIMEAPIVGLHVFTSKGMIDLYSICDKKSKEINKSVDDTINDLITGLGYIEK